MLRRWVSMVFFFGSIVAFLVPAPPASAHVISEYTLTYRSSTNCTGSYSEVSDGTFWGYAKGTSDSYREFFTPVGNINCGKHETRPAGNIAVRWDYWYWRSDHWEICVSSAWYYNSITTTSMQLYKLFSDAPCWGSTYYGTVTFSKVRWDKWYPSTPPGLWSGCHFIPGGTGDGKCVIRPV